MATKPIKRDQVVLSKLKTDLYVFQRDGYTCKLCGDSAHGSHVFNKNNTFIDVEYDDLITICSHCLFIIKNLPDISYHNIMIKRRLLGQGDHSYEYQVVVKVDNTIILGNLKNTFNDPSFTINLRLDATSIEFLMFVLEDIWHESK